jgi:hypothetical protein
VRRSPLTLPFPIALLAAVVLGGAFSAPAAAVSTVKAIGGNLSIADRDESAQSLTVRRNADGDIEVSDPAGLNVPDDSGGLAPERNLCTPGSGPTTVCRDIRSITILAGGGDDQVTVDVPPGTSDIPDGTSNTILFGEQANIVTVSGGPGDDLLVGGASPETLIGGPDVDTIRGNGGGDNLDAGLVDRVRRKPVRVAQAGAAETVDGGTGNDRVRGSDGDDVLLGGQGTDLLDGRGGNDTLDGGTENDSMQGGAGIDTADYSARTEPVDVTVGDIEERPPPPDDFTGNNVGIAPRAAGNGLIVVGFLSRNDGGATDVSHEPGNTNRDAVGPDVERVLGGSAADRLVGDDSDETLVGGDGDDTVDGGAGSDALDGAGGADALLARDGVADSALDCGPGNDTLVADPNDPPGTGCEPPGVDNAVAGTPPPALRAAAPILAVLTRRARLARNGDAALRILCAGAGARCGGRLRVVVLKTVSARFGTRTLRLRKGTVLLDRAISIWRERASTQTFRPGRRARRLIKRLGRLRVRVVVEAADESFPADLADVGTARRRVTLRRARR